MAAFTVDDTQAVPIIPPGPRASFIVRNPKDSGVVLRVEYTEAKCTIGEGFPIYEGEAISQDRSPDKTLWGITEGGELTGFYLEEDAGGYKKHRR